MEVTKESLPIGNVHVYRLNCLRPEFFDIYLDNSSEGLMVGQIYQLPFVDFEQLWERLIFDDDIKHEVNFNQQICS